MEGIEKVKANQIQNTDVTPNQLLQMAVEKDIDLARLEKFMDLQERHENNEARKAFVEAMSVFRSKCPVIIKNHTVDFTSTKGRTHYKHAGLSDAIEQIKGLMSECGLSHSWFTIQKDNGITVRCVITHIDGHSEETSLTAPADNTGNKNVIQAIGSTITYLQRYTLFSLLGLASQDDDDGNGVDDKKKIEPPEKEPSEWIDEACKEYMEKHEGEVPENHYIVPKLFKSKMREIFKGLPKKERDKFTWDKDSVKMLVLMLKLEDVIEEVPE